MNKILLVDDDPGTATAVKLALPRIAVSVVGTRHEALTFLDSQGNDIDGVIVDIDLTEGHDNFGRTVLERLREIGMPAVVFSGSIRSPADAARYANEFGVLATIGKEKLGGEGSPTVLQQLRASADLMIAKSLERLRTRVRAELERELLERELLIQRDRQRSNLLVDETAGIAGPNAAARLRASETERLDSLVAEGLRVRKAVVDALDGARTREELEALRTELPRSLGAM